LGTNSALALGLKKTTENLDRVGRSQDLAAANRLLANRTLTLVPICAVSLSEKLYMFLFTDVSFHVHTLDAQTVVCNICEDKYMHTNIHIFVIIWVFVSLNINCVGGRGIRCCVRLVAHPATGLYVTVHSTSPLLLSAILSSVGNWSVWPLTDWTFWDASQNSGYL
jgi:hypothetical protein